LKELYDELERRRLMDDTWIVLTADHGEEFGEHGNIDVGHGLTLYGEVLRVPLIFHPAEAQAGKRLSRQVRLIDVAPTILDLVGVPIPEEMEGVSLEANVVGGEEASGEDLLAISQVGGNDGARDKDLFAVTTKEFKYILDFQSGAEELYDLRADPEETRNVAEANPDRVRAFKSEALSFRAHESARRGGVVEGAEIDEELKEQLRALGYLK
jgi:arylsulfatase A-like enzyme